MTLIAAFRCFDTGGVPGVIICADTQETRGGFRVPAEKIAIQNPGHYQLVVGGAGERGNLIDDFVETLGVCAAGWEAGLNEQALRLKVKRVLKEFHDNVVSSEPASDEAKWLEFIICLKDRNSPNIYLWRTGGTGLKTVTDFALVGLGETFFISQVKKLYRPDISMPQAVLLAIHVLSNAIETITDIGGPTRIIGVRAPGMFPVEQAEVQALEQRVAAFNQTLAALVLACPDISISQDKFIELIGELAERLAILREYYMNRESAALFNRVFYDKEWKGEQYMKIPVGVDFPIPAERIPDILAEIEAARASTLELKQDQQRDAQPSDSEKSEGKP